jgi:hypothetical protein
VLAAAAGFQALAEIADAQGGGGGGGKGGSRGPGAKPTGAGNGCCNKAPATGTAAAVTTAVVLTTVAQNTPSFTNAIAGPQSSAVQALVAPAVHEAAKSAVAASANSMGLGVAAAVVATGAAVLAAGYGAKKAYDHVKGTGTSDAHDLKATDELTEVKTTG